MSHTLHPDRQHVTPSPEPAATDAHEARRLRLLNPQHAAFLQDALRSLPRKVVTDVYLTAYRANEFRGSKLLGRPLRRAQTTDIIAAIPRLYAQPEKVAEKYADLWLQAFTSLLERLERRETPADDLPHEALRVATWLLQFERDAPDQEALTRALERARQLEEELRAARAALQQAEARSKAWEGEANAREKQNQNLLRRVEQAVQAERERQQGLLERERARHERERQKLLASIKAQDARHAKDLANLQQQLEAARAECDRLRLEGHAVLQARLQDAQQQVRERDHRISELQSKYLRQLREKHDELERVWAQLDTLQQRPASPFTDELLDGALIVHYSTLHEDAVQRFTDLFGLYRALLKRRYDDDRLQRCTNISEFVQREPQGILVLGLEQLLEDGANLALERFLRMRSLRQESLMQQLLERVQSPRLGGQA
ncbi:hypothetical protein [Deinococcus sp. YIM 77859]|uniref:hypothetical protein n=1 Tax=Deinococcus sp. YIM 77859 TaxID=1540221 RepID=UPI00054D709B|nr:hypothetical protein [Deinococcus sp. YIM 77859]